MDQIGASRLASRTLRIRERSKGRMSARGSMRRRIHVLLIARLAGHGQVACDAHEISKVGNTNPSCYADTGADSGKEKKGCR